MSLIPNTTQVPHIIIRDWMKNLSDTGLRVLLVIVDQTLGWEEDPITHNRKKEDWIAYSQLKEKTSRANTAISNALRELESKGYIQITDGQGRVLITKSERTGKKLYYRIVTSPESGEVDPNLSGKRNPQSGETKETNTKATNTKVLVGGYVEKQPACPLLNGSPLKIKYPGGHTECVDFLISEEEIRKRKFINRPKQFLFIHKILKAGFDFESINHTIMKIEAKNGKGGWDFSTVASWLERGG